MTVASLPAVTPIVADLVLARLAVAAKTPPSAADVRKDVGSVIGHAMSADTYTELSTHLLDEGLVERRPKSKNGLQLTTAGRARVSDCLGVSEIPPRTYAKTVQTRFLLPRALGITTTAAQDLNSADRLTALLLRREYDLPAGATTQALEAVVCRQLGRSEASFDELYRSVLSDVLGSDERLSKADIAKQFPRKLTGAKSGKLDDLRQAIVKKWLNASPHDRNAAPPANTAETVFDLSAFAATVKRIARDCPPTARFGSNKVFIAAAWRESQSEDGFPRMPLGEFKAHLVEANRAGLIRLEPADLVQAMDPALVAESRTEQAGAALHFILIEETRP